MNPNRKKFRIDKKYVAILAFVVLLVFVSANFVFADETGGGLTADPDFAPDGSGMLVSFLGSKLLQLVNVLLQLILSFAILLYEFSGKLVEFAIGASTDTFADTRFVSVGWAATRDLANVFFIFILLFIAIATILRLEGYGLKRLLPRLILMALLINFSLLISQYVIQPSNWLTLYFEDQIEEESGNMNNALKNLLYANTVLNISDSNVNQAFSDAPGNNFKLSNPATSAVNNVLSFFFSDSDIQVELTKGVVGLFSIVFFYVGAFVLMAVFIMIVIRTVVLMFLMVLAPLAFLFHILPATQGYARKWWETLISQSFFLPALMFLIFLAVDMNQNVLRTIAITPQANILTDYRIMFIFALMTTMLIASLVIARQMGAYGAGMAIAWSSKAQKAVAGYAGAVAVARPIARGARAYTESDTGKKFAAQSKFIGGAVFKGMQKASKFGGLEKTEKEELDLLKKLPSELRADRFGKLSEGQKRSAISGMNKDELQSVALGMEKRGRADQFTKEVKRLSGRENELLSILPGYAEKRDKTLINKIDFEKVPTQHLVNDSQLMGDISLQASSKQAQKIIERNDELTDEYQSKIKAMWDGYGKDANKVADAFTQAGNQSMATLFRSRQKVRDLFGFKGEEKPESSKS